MTNRYYLEVVEEFRNGINKSTAHDTITSLGGCKNFVFIMFVTFWRPRPRFCANSLGQWSAGGGPTRAPPATAHACANSAHLKLMEKLGHLLAPSESTTAEHKPQNKRKYENEMLRTIPAIQTRTDTAELRRIRHTTYFSVRGVHNSPFRPVWRSIVERFAVLFFSRFVSRCHSLFVLNGISLALTEQTPFSRWRGALYGKMLLSPCTHALNVRAQTRRKQRAPINIYNNTSSSRSRSPGGVSAHRLTAFSCD